VSAVVHLIGSAGMTFAAQRRLAWDTLEGCAADTAMGFRSASGDPSATYHREGISPVQVAC
jgi:hypothetical protein